MALISLFDFLVCILFVGSQCNSSNSSRSQTSKWTNNLFRKRYLTTNSDSPYPGLFLADDGREAKEMWNISKMLCEDEQRSNSANHGRLVSFILIMIGFLHLPFFYGLTASSSFTENRLPTQQSATLIPTPPRT